MRNSLRLLASVSFSWWFFWGVALSAPADRPAVGLEFRRAETKPAEGLEEATVPRSAEKIYLHKSAEVSAKDIAKASIEKQGGETALKLVFTREGMVKMEKLTKEHRDKPLAVLLDGKVLVAPVVRSTITDQALLNNIGQAEMEKIVKGITGR